MRKIMMLSLLLLAVCAGSLKIREVIFNRINLDNERLAKNPFRNFIGEWTLKNDDWSQNWGNGDEQVKIPHHHTVNRELNTANTLLSVIDGTPPHGHIVWTYNLVKKIVNHLSSFGEIRIGTGQGTVDDQGNVTLKVSFEDEAPGTYRIYTYKWLSENSYVLRSDQFDSAGKPTGLYYGGTFVRMIR